MEFIIKDERNIFLKIYYKRIHEWYRDILKEYEERTTDKDIKFIILRNMHYFVISLRKEMIKEDWFLIFFGDVFDTMIAYYLKTGFFEGLKDDVRKNFLEFFRTIY